VKLTRPTFNADHQILRAIEAAKAAGLRKYRVRRSGRETIVEVDDGGCEDNLASAIAKMSADDED
jgi:hypothetical protein